MGKDLSLEAQHACQNLGTVACVHNPSTGEAKTGRPWGLFGPGSGRDPGLKSKMGKWKGNGCLESLNLARSTFSQVQSVCA